MPAVAEQERGARATPGNWIHRPPVGWTYHQVKDSELPSDWELLDGNIAVRVMAVWWHNRVRNQLNYQLQSARREPFAVECEQCVVADDHNAPKPDVMVYDRSGLDVRTVEQIPVHKAVLAVELVSEGSRLSPSPSTSLSGPSPKRDPAHRPSRPNLRTASGKNTASSTNGQTIARSSAC